MVVRLLDVDKGSFRLQENDEELLGLEVPYLGLMYLANYTQFDIAFVINLLTKI